MTRLLPALLALLIAAGCSHTSATPDASAVVPARWEGSRQMVVVTVPDWNAIHGRLQRYERLQGNDAWHAVGTPQPVVIGRNGAAWGLGLHPAQASGPQKREGDGRAPAGVFSLGDAFGYAELVPTGLPYRPMTRSHWCMDVAASPLYNRIVDAAEVGEAAVAGSSEPMRLDLHSNGSQSYREGFVIEHNAGNVPGMGSCIFAHLWKTPDTPTAGCTAMAETSMGPLLGWLREDAYPVFVLLPQAEYARLARQWSLPEAPR